MGRPPPDSAIRDDFLSLGGTRASWHSLFPIRLQTLTINSIKLMMLIVMSTTTIPVKRETLARLRSYKVGGVTYDDVLNDLMDDRPPIGFIREHLRRLKEEEFSDWKDVRKRLRL